MQRSKVRIDWKLAKSLQKFTNSKHPQHKIEPKPRPLPPKPRRPERPLPKPKDPTQFQIGLTN